MNVGDKYYHTIWLDELGAVNIIDQRWLPHDFRVVTLKTVEEVATAIREMWVRGAPLIGITAAFGMYLATKEAAKASNWEKHLRDSAKKLNATRPTAVNLEWAIAQQLEAILKENTPEKSISRALQNAQRMKQEDIHTCQKIGEYGVKLIEKISASKHGETVHILTHCNAGWLACIDWGTATSPIYQAHDKGIKVHVWVDETRPRNQGARITAWELGQHGVPHTVITDNVGGLLMQQGRVDMCIVGTDRTTSNGDVANKIGTYLKALAAKDNHVPFYVALPASTIDWAMKDGRDIPIEERSPEEVTHIYGLYKNDVVKVRLTPDGSPALNLGFDITPARLVTALITERGICAASKKALIGLFPEHNNTPPNL